MHEVGRKPSGFLLFDVGPRLAQAIRLGSIWLAHADSVLKLLDNRCACWKFQQLGGRSRRREFQALSYTDPATKTNKEKPLYILYKFILFQFTLVIFQF